MTGSGGNASPGTGGAAMPGSGGSSGTGGGSGGTSAGTGGTTGSGGGAATASGGAAGGKTGASGGSAGTTATGGATGGSNSGGGRNGSGGAAGASGAGSGGQGGASSPAAELEGAGWTMKCTKPSGNGDNQCYLYPPGQSSCPSGGYMSVDQTLHFGGTAGTTYDVTIHFQGTHEAGDYSGGTKITNQLLKNAMHTASGPHTWLAMEVSAPAATYNPNSGGGAGSVQVYDYMATIQIQGGATIHLTGHDSDCLMHRYCQNNVLNPCKGLVVPDISPADSPIDGSFLNMHVVSVVAK